MEYLCSECSTQLSKFELGLNKEFPIGKLYCLFCQTKKERQIIKELSDSISDLSFYDYLKTIAKMKKEEKENKTRTNDN